MEDFKTRIVEWVFCIGYDDNIQQARKFIIDEIFADNRVINKTKPFISVSALTENTVNLTVSAEVRQNDYWDVFYEYLEKVKVRFDREGVHFPFPQQDIHIIQDVQVNNK